MNVLAALKCVRNNKEIGLDEKLMVLSVTFFYVKLMHCLIKGRDWGWMNLQEAYLFVAKNS